MGYTRNPAGVLKSWGSVSIKKLEAIQGFLNVFMGNLVAGFSFFFLFLFLLSKPFTLSNSATTLRSFANQLSLCDPWRALNPSTKAFSFFSHVHRTYSRIDFFFVDNRLLHWVNSSEYHSIVISDHAPTSVVINFPNHNPTRTQWKLSHFLLNNPHFKGFFQEEIVNYFHANDTPDIARSTLWEACKAYLRGQAISFASRQKKVDTERMVWLLDQLVSIDTQYATAPTPSLYDQRLKFQAEFDLLSTPKVESKLSKTKQRYFEMGDKAGKLLAHQARTAALSRLIPRIKLSSGTVVTDPKLVNYAFLNFYSDLYTSEYSPAIWKSHNPLEMFSYPKVDSSLSDKLGAPITAAEVQEAIGQLQNGKSPGPDGFVVEFYKAYSILISPHLVNVYNESFNSGRLPPTLSEANISLLWKKVKDPLE